MGFKFRTIEKKIASEFVCLLMSVISVLVISLSVKWEVFARLQPALMRDENPFAIILIASIGSIGVYCISILLSRHKFLKSLFAIIGEHSFSIMLLHFASFKIVNFLICMIEGYDIQRISDFPCVITTGGWWIIYAIVGVFTPIVLSYSYRVVKNAIVLYVRNYNN